MLSVRIICSRLFDVRFWWQIIRIMKITRGLPSQIFVTGTVVLAIGLYTRRVERGAYGHRPFARTTSRKITEDSTTLIKIGGTRAFRQTWRTVTTTFNADTADSRAIHRQTVSKKNFPRTRQTNPVTDSLDQNNRYKMHRQDLVRTSVVLFCTRIVTRMCLYEYTSIYSIYSTHVWRVRVYRVVFRHSRHSAPLLSGPICGTQPYVYVTWLYRYSFTTSKWDTSKTSANTIAGRDFFSPRIGGTIISRYSEVFQRRHSGNVYITSIPREKYSRNFRS